MRKKNGSQVNIALLIPDNGSPDSIFDATVFFTWANHYLLSSGKAPMFNLVTIGLTRKVNLNTRLFSVNVDHTLKGLKLKADLVLIPSVVGDFPKLIKLNKDFFPWIIRQHKGGAEIASLCLGVFLLAATGLLDHKECPVHWYSANEFREMFPAIKVTDGKIITHSHGIYSSASGISHWNLLLYFLEKFTDRETAIAASKMFALDIGRDSQLPFVVFNGRKNHDDEPIRRAQEYIEKNCSEKLSVEGLALKFAIGRRHFERRFKKATNNTPLEYIQRVKVEVAKRQLESGQKNVTEVMYDLGYSDRKAFGSIFNKYAGMTPSLYKMKFNRQ